MTDPAPTERPRVGRATLPLGGIALVVVGVVFLLSNFGIHLTHHWWAALILVPASASLVTATRFYRQDGRLSERTVYSLAAGLALLILGVGLLLGVDFQLIWPIILIIIGLGIILRGYWPDAER